jgi:hypothetical protein
MMLTNLVGADLYIKTLPVKEVYILDQTNSELKQYPTLYENLKKDIFEALLRGKQKLPRWV